MSAWLDHVAKWKNCTRCPLHTQRGNIVFARGDMPADIAFIGEAPGLSEDATGKPFDGPAGGLLDQIIERAVPKEVTRILTNLVCCFPREAKARGDNEPEHAEILACRPRLEEFLCIVQPRLIVCVGALAEAYVRIPTGVRSLHIIHPAATFPPRMARIQASNALNNARVKLQCAVEDMLSSPANLTDWGAYRASIQTTSRTTRQQLRADYADADIPF